jgi:hypothetical protein
MLKRQLVKDISDRMLGLDGILSSFSARTDIAFAIGLLTKRTYDNLNVIRKVRNMFAHEHIDINFADKDVQALCNGFQLPKSAISGLSDAERDAYIDRKLDQKLNEKGGIIDDKERKDIKRTEKTRWKFIRCAVNMQSIILLDGLALVRTQEKVGGIPMW